MLLLSLMVPLLQKDDSVLSSDLSIELSQHEEPLPILSFQEDEESPDEEELPSFLMQTDKSETYCSDSKRTVLPDMWSGLCEHTVYITGIVSLIVFQSHRLSQKECLYGTNLEIIHFGLHW